MTSNMKALVLENDGIYREATISDVTQGKLINHANGQLEILTSTEWTLALKQQRVILDEAEKYTYTSKSNGNRKFNVNVYSYLFSVTIVLASTGQLMKQLQANQWQTLVSNETATEGWQEEA